MTLALLGAISALVTAAPNVGTIFVVRHAERAGPSADALSAVGQARASCLAATLRDAPIAAVIETQFVRTRQTAEPTAKQHHVAPLSLKADDIAAIVAAARARSHSGDVLVVGHGDTVPGIVKALTGASITVPASSYDQLFIVRDGALVALRYCPAAEPGPQSQMMR